MKQHVSPHRLAIAALSAALSLPFNPVSAQQAPAPVPVVNAPPPAIVAPAQPVASPPTGPVPIVVTPQASPPPSVELPPLPRSITAPPPEVRSAPARAATRTRAEPAARRAPARAAPVRAVSTPAAEPAPAPAAAPPVAAPAALPPAPVAAPPAAAAPAVPAPAESGTGVSSLWPFAAGALLLGAIALFFLLRRRRADRDEVVYEDYGEAPIAEAPIERPVHSDQLVAAAAVPVAASADEPAESVAAVDELPVAEPDAEDLAAVAAGSTPVAGRPWLELLLRPIRAGTTADETRVEFELTVGNTGSVPARDVRIASWMFAAGSAPESEMERMLIEPPEEARISEVTIEPGDGARVEAAMALPRESFEGEVLPVVVADARYALPDGGEGRISAAFAIGPAAAGPDDALESRLYGEVQRA